MFDLSLLTQLACIKKQNEKQESCEKYINPVQLFSPFPQPLGFFPIFL
jgi:hypothetical protein